MYCDFELIDKQFEARYSKDYDEHYRFKEDFFRAELNPDVQLTAGFDDFESYVSNALERCIVQSKARVVIIDNLTYLRGENKSRCLGLRLISKLSILQKSVFQTNTTANNVFF